MADAPTDKVTDGNGDENGTIVEEQAGRGKEKARPTCVVRYGFLNHVGEFTYREPQTLLYGTKVVIQTQRGIELGEHIAPMCADRPCAISREQVTRYIENSGGDYMQLNNGRILREATTDDVREDRHLREGAQEKMVFCKELAYRHGLAIELVDCEHLLGGERIIFYFMADGRVDFRQLVKDLAHEYQTRIEMHQVGARDEARLVADYETCGRECCCKNFLKTLRPISMKMAKLQKATLDPSKVSGRCGRLKCCLRYEHESYEELDHRLPKLGARIRTNHGDGAVVNRQVLAQLVHVETEEGCRVTVGQEDILGPWKPDSLDQAQEAGRHRSKPARDLDESKERTEPGSSPGDAAQAEPDVKKPESKTEAEASQQGTTQHKTGASKSQRRRGSRRRGRRKRGRNGGDSVEGSSDGN